MIDFTPNCDFVLMLNDKVLFKSRSYNEVLERFNFFKKLGAGCLDVAFFTDWVHIDCITTLYDNDGSEIGDDIEVIAELFANWEERS